MAKKNPLRNCIDFATRGFDGSYIRFSPDGVEVSNKPFKSDYKIPERYIFNENATILIWEDKTKTIVKKSKEDKYDKRMAFLTAYFQKNSGLTKNKANKYLDNLEKEDE